jgi:hypothetical protein
MPLASRVVARDTASALSRRIGAGSLGMRFAATGAMTQPIPPGQPPGPQPTPSEPAEAPPRREVPEPMPPSDPVEEPLQSDDDTPRAPND